MIPVGPHVKLAIDLQRMEKYFPPEGSGPSGYDFPMAIDRPRYDQVETILKKYNIDETLLHQEFCFVLLWMQNYIGVFEDMEHYPLKFNKMWVELDGLRDYLLKNRVTSIAFYGEDGRKMPENEFAVEEDINIDRICDGIRSVFREEFQSDRKKRQTRGKKVWKTRKMVKVKNYVLNYMAKVPGIAHLTLEEQTRIFDKLSYLAGIS
jgi:hypothetical protein